MPRKPLTKSISRVSSKEEHYRTINAELEAKSADLFKEADSVLMSARNMDSLDGKSDKLKSVASFKSGDICELTSVLKITPGESHVSDSLPQIPESVHDQSMDIPFNAGDTLPEPTQQLSLKSQNRCLQARVRVLQEELQKMATQLKTCHEENAELKKRLQESEDERTRLQRASTGHNVQLEKLKRNLDEAKSSCEALTAERDVLRKENNALKRNATQHDVESKSVSARLQRLSDENERLKNELSKSRAAVRDVSEGMKHKVDQLSADNRRLERQKSELVNAFKKQLRLVDVLKRQKMLLEASRCLQLTEEEFLNTLDRKS